MGFPKDYAKAMYNEFGFQVMWPPNATIALGDFGTVTSKKKGATFTKVGNITDYFDVHFKVSKSPAKAVESLQSTGTTVTNVTGQGGYQQYAAALKIGFSKANSMIYNGAEVVIENMSSLIDVGNELARLVKSKKWDSKWVLVTDIHATNGLTVLLSSEKDASISLSGSADLSAGNMAKVSADVSVISKSKQIADYIVKGPATPLLKARRVTQKGIVTMKALDDSPVMVLSDGDSIDLGSDEKLAEVTFDYCDLDADKLAD